MAEGPAPPTDTDASRPEWFAAFLADRGTRKPSAHTLKAYRQDFDAIAARIDDGEDLSGMAVAPSPSTPCAPRSRSMRNPMRRRRFSGAGRPGTCCVLLFTAELIEASPMPMVGRPKLAKTLPKAIPADSVAALLGALNADQVPRRRNDWIERDRALILTALLAGLRADELVRANVGDLRRSDHGAVPARE